MRDPLNGISTSTLANAIVSNFGNPMDIDAVLAVLGQSLIEGAFSFGELIDFMECMNVPGLSNTLANNFSNQGLLHQLIVSNASQEYLLVLAMLNDTDFVKYVAENYSYLVAEAVRKLEGMSVEQYLALVKKHYGDGVMGDLLTALGADLQFTKKFVLNEHHLYGSSRLGVKTHKRVLLRKEFSISGFEPSTGSGQGGEYIVDEVTDSLVYVKSEEYFYRVLAQKQYELSNHLGNVLATVLDRKTGVFDEGTDTLMYYEADVVNAKVYYPFGKAMMSYSNPEFSFAYAFNGMERDDETGLTDFVARFYSEDYGRFGSVDPMAQTQPGWSSYKSFYDNPIIYIDPDGNVEKIATITYDPKTDKTQIEITYANKVMTDGIERRVWTGSSGYYFVNDYYDINTVVYREVVNGKAIVKETISEIDKSNGIRKSTNIWFSKEEKGHRITEITWLGSVFGKLKKFSSYGITIWGKGGGKYSRNGTPVGSLDIQELEEIFGLITIIPGGRKPSVPNLPEVIEKATEVVENEIEKKKKKTEPIAKDKKEESNSNDSTQCDVPGGCGTTGHIHVNGEPYHKPGPGKTNKDYNK